MKERINRAAILLADGNIISLPWGARHPAIMLFCEYLHLPLRGAAQGFLTNRKRFVHRDEAYDIAKKASQFLPACGRGMNYESLYTEDLW